MATRRLSNRQKAQKKLNQRKQQKLKAAYRRALLGKQFNLPSRPSQPFAVGFVDTSEHIIASVQEAHQAIHELLFRRFI